MLNLDRFIKENFTTLGVLFSNLPDLLFLMEVDGDTFRYVLMNNAAMQCAGLSLDAYGKSIEEVIQDDRGSTLHSYYRQAARLKQVMTFVQDHEGAYGETVLTPIIDDNGVCTHVLGITRDITTHQMYQRQLTHLAYHDALTGLANRRQLLDSLITLEAGARERDQSLVVLYIDCDVFKSINDQYGHDVGDKFLVALSKRLRNCLREADILCRLGGDEFVAVSSMTDCRDAATIGERILKSVSRPWTIEHHSFRATISIGMAFYPADGGNLETVMKIADLALQTAKNTGGNRYVIYNEVRV